MSDHVKLLLVGAGPMSIAYAKVLKAQNISFAVSGRGQESGLHFYKETGVMPILGGLDDYFKFHPIPSTAIVATGVEALASCTETLLKAGVKDILLEKPGGLDSTELTLLNDLAKAKNARVVIAYNRRFYASVERATQIIKEDGGLREVYFEFTEWSNVIAPLKKAKGVKEKWFLANSTHVVDLVFHLAGVPKDWKPIVAGGNDWHPSGTRFVGSGSTEKKILFTYAADWEAAGRWGIELLTKQRRLILKPLELLAVQKINSVTIENEPIDDKLDKAFKPGLFQQVQAFLSKEDVKVCLLEEQLKNLRFYNLMAGYSE